MPICDGWEASQRIRAFESEQSLKVKAELADVSEAIPPNASPSHSPRSGAQKTGISNGPRSPSLLRVSQPSGDSPASTRSLHPNPRVPIIAVSASLNEAQYSKILESGMDGWVLKPVDFGRLSELMKGIRDPEKRKANTYKPGAYEWERGGWLRD